MKIKVNGTIKEFDPDTTLITLMDSLGIEKDAGGIAAAVNDAVVSKTKWSRIKLSDGDVVEIIRAVQGG